MSKPLFLLLLLVVLPLSFPLSDFESSVNSIQSTIYVSTLCWLGLTNPNLNCEAGPLQQSATPTSFTPDIVADPVEVQNNTKNYYKKMKNTNIEASATTGDAATSSLRFSKVPASVKQVRTVFTFYITLTRSYTPRHAPRPLIPPLLQDTTFALTIALVDANSNLASIHDTCTVKLEVLNAAATLDLDGDNSWLLYDLVLTATSSTSPLEYGIAEFVGLSLNIPNTHVYLKAYCLENLLMMVTSTAHILVRETISVEQQLVDAQTISLPTGNGWTSTHNEAPNQYTVDAKILSASDSLFSTTCTSDTTNCHDNWEGDFHVFEMYDDPSCTPSTKLYDDYRKDNACR